MEVLTSVCRWRKLDSNKQAVRLALCVSPGNCAVAGPGFEDFTRSGSNAGRKRKTQQGGARGDDSDADEDIKDNGAVGDLGARARGGDVD